MTNSKVQIPEVKDILKAGVQFGHETKRWNPKMSKYIFGERNKIHIIDITQTAELLGKAAEFMTKISAEGTVIFIGTKAQAADIARDAAVKSGSFFINKRWAGGLLTNFEVIQKSLKKLNDLERAFEEGVEGRTKYEISRMKKEWQRLERLYSGIKTMEKKPVAAIVVDVKYEEGVIKECRKMGVPVIGIVDTNSDPDLVDYVIPANDDAIGSIGLILNTLADAILIGNQGNGVKHQFKDYSKVEVKITKATEVSDSAEQLSIPQENRKVSSVEPKKISKVSNVTKAKRGEGILERAKKESLPKIKKTKTTKK